MGIGQNRGCKFWASLGTFSSVNGPLEGPPGTARPPNIPPSAQLPRFFGPPIRLHAGLLIELAVAFLLYYPFDKTTIGLELKTVGQNPHAALYSGINITLITVLTLTLSGFLAGVGGACHAQGLIHNVSLVFSGGYGFDAIAGERSDSPGSTRGGPSFSLPL